MKHVFWCNGHDVLIPDVVKGEGCYLVDAKGKRYLDLESGIWCVALGHSHPGIEQAVREQLAKLAHTGFCYATPVLEEAARTILDCVGWADGRCLFLCSGSEAVEFGLQALRLITGKPRLLTLMDSYLGAYGSAKKAKADEWYVFDWSDCAACPTSQQCDPDCPAFAAIPFETLGGFVLEPGSASGLVKFPTAGLIHQIAARIRQQGGFIQANEITTGLGRTGKWFGFQHYDIQPDIISMGKGLGNGYPVSAVALSTPVAQQMQARSFHYGQSHLNDSLGAAVAKTVLTALQQEGLIANSAQVGHYFLERLQDLQRRHPGIREIRGRGLMLAIELQATLPEAAVAKVYRQCIERGYILTRRPGLPVFRLDPPLCIRQEELDSFLNTFDQILSEVDPE